MPVRHSLRWKIDLPDPGELLSGDEREEDSKLAWTVFVLLLAGIAVSALAVFSYLS